MNCIICAIGSTMQVMCLVNATILVLLWSMKNADGSCGILMRWRNVQ